MTLFSLFFLGVLELGGLCSLFLLVTGSIFDVIVMTAFGKKENQSTKFGLTVFICKDAMILSANT